MCGSSSHVHSLGHGQRREAAEGKKSHYQFGNDFAQICFPGMEEQCTMGNL